MAERLDEGLCPLMTDVPQDVLIWLMDTYTHEEQAIWLRAYDNASEDHRERMVRLARSEGNG